MEADADFLFIWCDTGFDRDGSDHFVKDGDRSYDPWNVCANGRDPETSGKISGLMEKFKICETISQMAITNDGGDYVSGSGNTGIFPVCGQSAVGQCFYSCLHRVGGIVSGDKKKGILRFS